jgi:antitoxin HicB
MMTIPNSTDATRGAVCSYRFQEDYRNWWKYFDESTLECRILICPEDVGGFSVHAMNLPGVVSEGETVDEAIANIRDAFAGAIAVYREKGEKIPWAPAEVERTKDSIERWILVDV